LRRERGKFYVPVEPETKTTEMAPEKRIAVERALQALPEDQREVVILKVFNDLKFEEIAAIQGAPVSTVKSRLYVSFEKLRGILG
jgi:RNA polymerase sigma-70 factor (ECF subfamily)